MRTTDQLIDHLVTAMAGQNAAGRQAYFIRESLYHLVRMAQSEYAADIKRSVALAVAPAVPAEGRRRSRLGLKKVLVTPKFR